MIDRALQAAGEGTVVIVARSHRHADILARTAWDRSIGIKDGVHKYHSLKFVWSGQQLLGQQRGALFADHQWVSDMQWVLDIMKEMKPND
jgi:hypothetical protein